MRSFPQIPNPNANTLYQNSLYQVPTSQNHNPNVNMSQQLELLRRQQQLEFFRRQQQLQHFNDACRLASS
ncbi:417_t:CDS:1, partial [Cetraspora pellucida]